MLFLALGHLDGSPRPESHGDHEAGDGLGGQYYVEC